jgi:uncharacterized membrane protein YagU involved in acid resistance
VKIKLTQKGIKKMKTRFSLQSALTAGLIATAAMTMFTFMAPLMGVKMDIPAMLAHTMGAPIIVGWVAHFMIGEILAVGFATVFLSGLNRNPDIKTGALYGLIPWFVAQVMVMPMMSILGGGSYLAGFFSGSLLIAMASLAGHLIYGAVLGRVYKPQIVPLNAAA